MKTPKKKKKTKTELRQEMQERLNAVPRTRQDGMNRDVCTRISVLPLYKHAQRIMAFLNMPHEVSLDGLIRQALSERKKIYVPRCPDHRHMEAVQLPSLEAAVTGAYGIRTAPDHSRVIDPSELDLILVPGLAFDEQGNRLGRGAGFYDRFLLQARPSCLVAVAWDMQVVTDVPVAAHDLKIPAVLTEQRFILQQL